MALPASGPISGSQIATELGLSATNLSLGGMIDSSSLSSTNPDKYSEFYGYSNLTAFLSNTSSPRNPCTIASSNTTFYHNGSNAFPVVGDIVYSDSAGTTPLFGGGRRWFFSGGSGGGKFVIQTPISGPDTGVVTSVGLCFP